MTDKKVSRDHIALLIADVRKELKKMRAQADEYCALADQLAEQIETAKFIHHLALANKILVR
jgi:F0F1-type ATP synthase membrane subunit b/b'